MKESGKMLIQGISIESLSPMSVLIGMRRVLMVRFLRILARPRVTATTATTTTATTTAFATATIYPSYSKEKVGAGILMSFLFGKIFVSATLVAGAKGSAL